MKKWQLFVFIAVGLPASRVESHCNPIEVDVQNGDLQITGGVLDSIGFAATMYINGDTDCGLQTAPGDRLISDVPGQDISGVAVDSGLYLEPLGRMGSGVGLPDQRWFWFWNGATESIELAPHQTPLRVRSILGFGSADLFQDATPVPTEVKVADPRASDLGIHSHLLRYELNDISFPVYGAYGFFARLTSPAYDPSEPFLVMINSGLSAASLHEAALGINYAAGSGDFDADGDFSCADIDALVAAIVSGDDVARFDLNHDGAVNASDLDVWLRHAGAAELPSESAYLPGDANLDGDVNGQDFVAWNSSKFSTTSSWCSGDFNADGMIDGQDFVIWNQHKFMTATDSLLEALPGGVITDNQDAFAWKNGKLATLNITPVPEPSARLLLLGMALVAAAWQPARAE